MLLSLLKMSPRLTAFLEAESGIHQRGVSATHLYNTEISNINADNIIIIEFAGVINDWHRAARRASERVEM